MCGIAGLLGIDPALARPAAERMQVALSHRGPDDRGLVEVPSGGGKAPVLLVHTRLSIVDLSPAGHQPMADHPAQAAQEPNWITFNGEIYNFRDLAPELAERGARCRTRCDTETILNAYRVWGVRAVERFAGMFAFCLVDPARGLVWLCRDRLGIKPLYVARPAQGGLLFASEVRALLAAGEGLVARRLRASAVESYLAQGAVIGNSAIVDGVSLLPAGESLVCDFDGRPQRTARYWSVAFGDGRGAVRESADAGDAARSIDPGRAAPARWRSEVVAELGLALRRSVSSHLLADVPVGLFLSSGIDSGAIAALARDVSSEPLRTFCIGFDAPEYDESGPARLTARDLATDHRELVLTGEEVLASFDDVLTAVDQPTVDGFNTFHVSRAVKRAGLTVALSGVGGDELFGGYASFQDVPLALRATRVLGHITPHLRGGELSRLIARAGGLRPFRLRARALHKVSQALARPPELTQLYFLRRELCSPDERRALQPLPSDSDPWCGVEHDMVRGLEGSPVSEDPVDGVARHELGAYMQHMLLRDGDVFSMRHGIELRVPLLDHRLVEQAARARSVWRVPDPRPKPLLIDAVGPRLPSRTFRTRKRGFTFPWGPWLRGPLRARAEHALHGETLRDAGLEPAAARALWQRFAVADPSVSPLAVLALVVLDSFVRREGLRA